MQKIFVLLGPTAVGKTAAVMKLAPYFGGIVYADTASLYTDLNIGSAKPSPAEQQALPHYLINLLTLNESFDAARYVALADEACTHIHQSGRPALLSGGTLFYLTSFLFGLSQAPKASEQSRCHVAGLLEAKGAAALYAELQKIDPLSAGRININDEYRLCRALEVYYDSGKPLSSFTVTKKLRSPYNFKIVILERDRDELYQRINKRVDLMFEKGLADEVIGLQKKGATQHSPAMKAIGYAEWFNSEYKSENDIKEAIKQNSRRYAKRQLTFLRGLSSMAETVEADNLNRLEELAYSF